MSGADRTGGVAAGTGLLPIADGARVDERQLGTVWTHDPRSWAVLDVKYARKGGTRGTAQPIRVIIPCGSRPSVLCTDS